MKLIHNLPKVQDADLQGKVVLMRVDHNVVKKGKIKDTTRIDETFPTICRILRKGGHLILMSHIGRPKDKKTGEINISANDSVKPIVEYLKRKLDLDFYIPEFVQDGKNGLRGIDTSFNSALDKLKKKEIDGIYLPNTRWFAGEESKGEEAEELARQFAGIADVFVNDAFGSWQPHVSTVGPARLIPSYAGILMQKEIDKLYNIFSPIRPFLGIVAGSKFDTKIGPLRALLEKADHLIVGGVLYNAYLCARYNISIEGIGDDDVAAAREFIKIADQNPGKLIEPAVIVESEELDAKTPGKYRSIRIDELKPGMKLKFVLDADPSAFEDETLKNVILGAKTIFTNAVMGFTPNFWEGTKAMYSLIDQNKDALKLFGGGDTIQEFKNLMPTLYEKTVHDQNYYFFTGGGTILKAIEEGSAYGLEPVKLLIQNHE